MKTRNIPQIIALLTRGSILFVAANTTSMEAAAAQEGGIRLEDLGQKTKPLRPTKYAHALETKLGTDGARTRMIVYGSDTEVLSDALRALMYLVRDSYEPQMEIEGTYRYDDNIRFMGTVEVRVDVARNMLRVNYQE